MKVEEMIAARVSEEFLKHLEIASGSIVLTKQEFMKAVGDAYIRGLDKGRDLEQIRCAGIVCGHEPMHPKLKCCQTRKAILDSQEGK
jgi:hypothetical protein